MSHWGRCYKVHQAVSVSAGCFPSLWMVSDIWTLTSVLCCFRLRPTPSAVWVMCTQRSATTPTPWRATNSACCWPDRPSVGSARPGSWATWAPCTRHWETSPTLFSVTSSTWTSQRYKTTSSDLWGSDGRGTFVLVLRLSWRTPTKNDSCSVNITETHCFSFTVFNTHTVVDLDSLEHQMWINAPLKIVPTDLSLSFFTSSISNFFYFWIYSSCSIITWGWWPGRTSSLPVLVAQWRACFFCTLIHPFLLEKKKQISAVKARIVGKWSLQMESFFYSTIGVYFRITD